MGLHSAKCCFLMALLLVTFFEETAGAVASPYGYLCNSGVCIKTDAEVVPNTMPMSTCKLTCDANGALWPKPRTVTMSKKVSYFLPAKVTTSVNAPSVVRPLLDQAILIFKDNLQRYHPDYATGLDPWTGPYDPSTQNHILEVDITVATNPTRLDLATDESYVLNVSSNSTGTLAIVIANTYFGARHALETLSQMVAYEEVLNSLQLIDQASVTDAPEFPYRGILLDTARNFISLAAIKRTLDAMAATKLNTFHWHITDTHSFPLYMNSLPSMVFYGAYSSRNIYYPADVVDVVEYGRVRGIRVMPEFDAPAHVGNGFQWGEKTGLGSLTVCTNREPWQEFCVEPPCGQFNLANPNIYDVISMIYKEMVNLFGPIDLFHYGGDEVNVNCWNTSKEVTDWMDANGFGRDNNAYIKQWSVFQEKARQLLTEANAGVEVPAIIWTSQLTEKGKVEQYLDKAKYIIQIWTERNDPVIGELLTGGYRVIFSNYDAWYLDCGFGAWVGEGRNWCSPYKEWQMVYDNSPVGISLNQTGLEHRDLILGGEAALWVEEVGSQAVDSRLWPRSAALAERLWSNPSTSWRLAETRMLDLRQRLVGRGIGADRLQPEWCLQNEGLCYA